MSNTDEISNQRLSIFYLLPYSEQTMLCNKHQKLDHLCFINAVMDYALIALEHFLAGELALFDAQVGEDLCQIRAYKIVQLARKHLNNSFKQSKLYQCRANLKSYKIRLEKTILAWRKGIRCSHRYDKNRDKEEGLQALLDRHDLFLVLEEDAVFIVCCYFLMRFSICYEDIPIAINLNSIAYELQISKYRAKRLMHKYQLVICQMGCDFILSIAKELHEKDDYKILPKLYKVSDENRAVLPCLMVTEVILHHCIQQQIPVFLIVYRKSRHDFKDIVYFILNSAAEQAQLVLTAARQNFKKPCLVISGHVQMDEEETARAYIHRFLKRGPLDIILANMACHPQYSGKKLAAFRENPFLDLPHSTKHVEKLETLQRFAIQSGCCKENQSTFFLRHIYASRISTEIKRLRASPDIPFHEAYRVINDGRGHGQSES